jgi:hypothetical protein
VFLGSEISGSSAYLFHQVHSHVLEPLDRAEGSIQELAIKDDHRAPMLVAVEVVHARVKCERVNRRLLERERPPDVAPKRNELSVVVEEIVWWLWR